MKYILFCLLIFTACSAQQKQPVFKDSLYNTFKPSEYLDSGNYHFSGLDSSDWRLFKIENINNHLYYRYYKIYSFGLTDKNGWNDLVGRMDKSYMKSIKLLPNCKISDTIPKAVHMYYPEDASEHILYYVDGIFGEKVR